MSKRINEYKHYIAVNAEETKSGASEDTNAYIRKYYDVEEDEILAFCQENCISCFISGKELVIETPVSLWKIIVNGQKHFLFLYHKNDIGSTEDPIHELVPGYHSQKCRRTTIIGYLEYIVAHDLYRDRNPALRHKAEKSVPKKGTNRYKRAIHREKTRKRREDISHVLKLLDSLHMQGKN